jgi:hypothetical protein
MLNQAPFAGVGTISQKFSFGDFPVKTEYFVIVHSLARFHPSMPEFPQAACGMTGIPAGAVSRVLFCDRPGPADAGRPSTPEGRPFYFLAHLQP